MTAAEYRKQYLAPITASRPTGGTADDRLLQALIPTPFRLYGPETPGEPLLLARRQSLLEILKAAMPGQAEQMDLPGLAQWLHQRELALGRSRELEQRNGELERERRKLQHALEHEQAQTSTTLAHARRLEAEADHLRKVVEQDQVAITHLTLVRDSTSYRLGRTLLTPVHYARVLRRLALWVVRERRQLGQALPHAWQLYRQGGSAQLRARFAAWRQRHEDLDRWQASPAMELTTSPDMIEERLRQLPYQPFISILMPTYNTAPALLREAVESVLGQHYPHWQLCIADDASTREDTRTTLEELAARDERIHLVWREQNGHISASSNSALGIATGEWVGLLDHDDLLTPDALFWVVEEINSCPDSMLIYSDEDKLSEDGHYYDPYFKPDWNPDLFLSQNYLNHFSVYRKTAVLAVGGFREGFEGSQDYDLALRVTGQATADQIRHIPRILYHWRAIATSTASCGTAKPYTVEAARRALAEHLLRTGHPDAMALPAPGCIGMWRIRYVLPETPPRVSIIIPTRNGYDLLHTCVESLLNLTSYPDYELLIVDNGSDDPETLDYLASLEQRENIRVLRDDRPFNYAALNNLAARQASGTVLALLNNDTEVIQGDWLREMVSHALRPEIGAVGARLWYPDDRLQHGGCILGVGGVANHAFLGLPRSQVGYFGRSALIQNYSAVTGACLVVRKEVYDAVQGLDETHLAVAFNDVDFCLRVREAGYRTLWTPYAELYHHESASRGQDMTGEKRARFVREVEYMMQRWGDILERDPAYNPNLSLEDAQFRIARHPRLPALAS